MSRFPTPSLHAAQPPPGPPPAGDWELTAPPWSKAALTGFICALLVIVPFVTQVLGLGFGIAGISVTRDRRRRGRGLAIAAIPISLVIAGVWTLIFGVAVVSFRAIDAANREVLAAMRTSADDGARTAAALYDNRASAGLMRQVDREKFTNWAAAVRAKHGQLQAFHRDPLKALRTTPAGQLEMKYIGEFVNGTAAIAIRYEGLVLDHARFDDVLVDGVSPATE